MDVLPITVSYPEVDGRPFSPATRNLVCWYGEMDFFPHLKALAATIGAKCVLHVSQPIEVRPEITRDELSARAHQAVSDAYFGSKSHTPEPTQTLAL